MVGMEGDRERALTGEGDDRGRANAQASTSVGRTQCLLGEIKCMSFHCGN